MLKSLEEIFDSKMIEVNSNGERIPIHSHTSKEQGFFLQSVFDIVKPARSLEVGFAYGISAMFILEKHRSNGSEDGAHIVIEPDNYWGAAAMHTIQKEGLARYLKVWRDYSDKVLTQLFHENHKIQYAYIDTTKQFDVVLQDFYFIDKMLDVQGVIILDDCGGGWPGIQRLARFIATLPHYKVLARHNKVKSTMQARVVEYLLSFTITILPFKKKFYPTFNFKTDSQLGLNYSCIAFQKVQVDTRNWNWDSRF